MVEKKETTNNKDVIETALKRFKLCKDAEAEIRKEALDDLDFRIGNQWPAEIERSRASDNRPCLTINKMPQYVRKITNDQRQNRPSIKVSPVDDNADVDTAEILQGLIRNIQLKSDAEVAYDTAFEGAATNSFGFFRIATGYINDKSFDQEAKIEMIHNPFNVYLDPYSVMPDGSDSKYGFIFDSMSKEDFEAEYGESKLANHEDWETVSNQHLEWVSEDHVRICEYYYKEFETTTLYLLSDNKNYFEDELPVPLEDLKNKEDKISLEDSDDFEDRLFIVDKRKAKRSKVYWCKINAIEVLEKTEWPGSYIPIIPVYGDTINVDGKIIREGVIRHAKDSQRIYNFWVSSEAEAITLAPKAPFIGAEGQFEGHEHEWKSANIKNHAYLEYNPETHGGQLLPAPRRNAFEPPVMAITNARREANEDIKSTTGIYDASLGARSNETSGIAIQRRNVQAETSNFHLIDNLTRSIRHAGRILIEIIPKIYDTPRTIRILGEDNSDKIVRINEIFEEKQGKQKEYNFSYGKYDVSVSTGPNFETKRQEARDSMLEMSRVNPKFAELTADLIAKNSDWPGADEMAERIKKTLPPNILGEDDKDIPQKAKAEMQQMNEMIGALTEQLKEARSTLDSKSMELESKERIEVMKIEADLKKELMRAESKSSSIILKEELELIKRRLDLLGINEPLESENEYENENETRGEVYA